MKSSSLLRLSSIGALATALLLASCSARTVHRKMADSEAIATEAEQLLINAEQAMARLEADKAEKILAEAQKKLGNDDVNWYPEREELRARAKGFAERIPTVRAERAKRDLEQALQAQRYKLEQPSVDAKRLLARLDAIDIRESDIDDAEEAQEELEDALDDGKSLERKDAIYGAEAMAHHKLLGSLFGAIQLAKRRLEFVGGPARLQLEGSALLAKGRTERDMRKRRDTVATARETLQSCARKGRAIITSVPELKRRLLLVQGQKRIPSSIIATCDASLRMTEKSIAMLDKQIAVADARAARKPKPKSRR